MKTTLKIDKEDELMENNDSSYPFSLQNAKIGRIIAWTVSTTIMIYLIVLILGFISLKAPDEPIGNPYFTILEILIIILAWDFFYALSMLFLSTTFRKKGLETLIRILLIVSGVLSFLGILGIPLSNMRVRNIGIAGYTVFAIIVFFSFGIMLKHRVRKQIDN